VVKELRLQILLHYHRKPDGSEVKVSVEGGAWQKPLGT